MKIVRTCAIDSAGKKLLPRAGRVRRVFILNVILLVTVFVHIAETASINSYVGADIGYASPTFDPKRTGYGLEHFNSDQTAWRLFAGATISKYVGVEAGYVHLGHPHAELYPESFEAEVTGFDVTPIGNLPFGKGFSVFARAGLIFWRSKMTITPETSPEAPWTETHTASNLAMGFGAKCNISRYLGIRAEYTRYSISRFNAGVGDYNCIWICGLFKFGAKD